MAIEHRIRDWLTQNLEFIEAGLQLIQKEFQLSNSFGSRGYVDILAKDRFGNFVIVEVKRSQASSRQTINEILKYVGLIKQNTRARDSEMRVIIVSTHWDELLVPFSELKRKNSLDVRGIHLSLDENNIPLKADVVEPLESVASRKFAKSYMIDLFYTEEKRTNAILQTSIRCEQIGLKDYVLLKLSRKDDPEVMFPFACCLAFQEADAAIYHQYFKAGGTESECDMERNEFDEESDYMHFLEQVVLITLQTHNWNDSAESGSPEKLDSILAMRNWKVDGMVRAGIFKEDPRLSDSMLINELRGLDGNNDTRYVNFGESTQQDRLTEISNNCLSPLSDNPVWAKAIEHIFQFLRAQKDAFRVVVSVYQPRSVFDSFCRIATSKAYAYLPCYLIFVDFIHSDKLWVFGGKLVWTGTPVNLENQINYLFNEDEAFINKFLDCVLGMYDTDVLEQWQLKYENTFEAFEGGKLVEEGLLRFEDGKPIAVPANDCRGLGDWLQQNEELQSVLCKLFAENTINY